ncbi:MAG: T9SS type A sorting domain-containing protein [Bacteroidetes bacterium]|nr:T9SS type A sorting domain-containing protein [Bacteroidota bacterium]MBU1717473.1 T9SS type A sorting domain-containing protein [Bacteroidota bacterium]
MGQCAIRRYDPNQSDYWQTTDLPPAENAQFIIYPNPASESIFITNTGRPIDYSATIYNSLGVEVRETADNPTKIPIFDLANGLYQVVIHTKDKVFTKNIVIKK